MKSLKLQNLRNLSFGTKLSFEDADDVTDSEFLITIYISGLIDGINNDDYGLAVMIQANGLIDYFSLLKCLTKIAAMKNDQKSSISGNEICTIDLDVILINPFQIPAITRKFSSEILNDSLTVELCANATTSVVEMRNKGDRDSVLLSVLFSQVINKDNYQVIHLIQFCQT